MGNNIRSSSRPKALAPSIPMPPLADAMDAVHLSVDRFCLLAGVEALAEMMEEDATTVCGARHRRHGDRRGYRWGHTQSEIGYHGGRVKVQRPRVRDHAGKEVGLESWQVLRDGNLLLEWALNLMVLNVSTRKYHRAVRLPEGDLAKARGDGTSKSAVSRRFVALSRKKMKAWLASDLSELDLLVIQIDGLHVGDHVLVAAIGVDGNGDKHVLAVVEGATENTVVVQALIDNLLARGLDPTLPRLFIVDGAKALSKAIRNTFGVAAAIQRCQVHKGRNIIERLPLHLHASVKKALRQAWDQDDADKAERLLRNLARRLEHEEPGVSGSILEGLEEILTVIRLGLPHELRRSLACTNIIENALGTVRQVTRNVKRWRNAEMALRWTAAGLLEAQKTFRRLKAYRQLPILRNALQEHLRKAHADSAIETIMKAAQHHQPATPAPRISTEIGTSPFDRLDRYRSWCRPVPARSSLLRGGLAERLGLEVVRRGDLQQLQVVGPFEHVVGDTGRLEDAGAGLGQGLAASVIPEPHPALEDVNQLEVDLVVAVQPDLGAVRGLGLDDMGVVAPVGRAVDAEVAVDELGPQPVADEAAVLGMDDGKLLCDFTHLPGSLIGSIGGHTRSRTHKFEAKSALMRVGRRRDSCRRVCRIGLRRRGSV